MLNLSDVIENFIKGMMDDEGSVVEIQRNMLAQQFECSPSQINYVLTTRFNNDRGYVRIVKVDTSKHNDIGNVLNKSIGDSITINKAFNIISIFREKGIISQREQNIMKSALTDRAFNKTYQEDRNKVRADILKEMILTIVNS